MPKQIFYLFAILCLLSGVRLAKVLVRRIKQRQNRYRAQQVMADYCEAAVRAKKPLLRPEIEDVERDTSNNIQTSAIARPESSSHLIKRVASPMPSRKPMSYSETSYRNTGVIRFQLLGNNYGPHTRKEMLVLVCEEMYRRHSGEFSRSLSLRGSRMPYFSQEPNELKQPMQIAGSDFFVETKLNSNSIIKRSRQLMRLFGYKESDLQISG